MSLTVCTCPPITHVHQLRSRLTTDHLHRGAVALALPPTLARIDPSGDEDLLEHVSVGDGGDEHGLQVVRGREDLVVGQEVCLLALGQFAESPGVSEEVDADVEGDDLVTPLSREKKSARWITSAARPDAFNHSAATTKNRVRISSRV